MGEDALSYPYSEEFTSQDPQVVARFYDHFSTPAELCDWLIHRPSSTPRLREVPGAADLIVVIPTASYDGPMARRCRDTTFKGQHLIFVESPASPDPFFNPESYLRAGFRRALELGPSWIAVAGDDTLLVDSPRVLTEGLGRLDRDAVDTVFTRPPGYYHSLLSKLAPARWLRRVAYSLSPTKRAVVRTESKFGVSLHAARVKGWESHFFGSGYEHLSFASFGIFSATYVGARNGAIFNESFSLGESGDVELSLRLSRHPERCGFVNYRIGELRGGTLGRGDDRRLRQIAGLALLDRLLRARPRDYFRDDFDYRTLLARRPVSRN